MKIEKKTKLEQKVERLESDVEFCVTALKAGTKLQGESVGLIHTLFRDISKMKRELEKLKMRKKK